MKGMTEAASGLTRWERVGYVGLFLSAYTASRPAPAGTGPGRQTLAGPNLLFLILLAFIPSIPFIPVNNLFLLKLSL